MSEVVIASEGASRVGLADITSSDAQYSVSPTSFRSCVTCHTQISKGRLKVMPNATLCVPCLEAVGDVAPAREYSVRCSLNNSELLTDLTEAPLLPVAICITGHQTHAEIISELNELEEVDTCDE